ncbi:MAG: hypothetical protein R3C14_37260 [Caldilineaceae bacterium]
MERITHLIRQPLPGNLVLRSVRDEQDIARCAAFVGATMRPISGITCERLLHHHPAVRHDDCLLVEDEERGEIVSTTCLIPWCCRFDKVILAAFSLFWANAISLCLGARLSGVMQFWRNIRL